MIMKLNFFQVIGFNDSFELVDLLLPSSQLNASRQIYAINCMEKILKLEFSLREIIFFCGGMKNKVFSAGGMLKGDDFERFYKIDCFYIVNVFEHLIEFKIIIFIFLFKKELSYFDFLELLSDNLF